MQKEWATITQKANFGNITEKELIARISKTKRRHHKIVVDASTWLKVARQYSPKIGS